jgi:glycosyltransferase involved in cell wall biosynthesis
VVILLLARAAQRDRETVTPTLLDDAVLQSICKLEAERSPVEGSPSPVSVFFPAFNDAESLRVLIPKIMETLRAITPDFEVIVVDDGSTDNTPDILEEMRGQFSTLRVVRHALNRGYGAALRSGFQASSKPLVFYTDGDGQYDVSELKDLLARLGDDVDVVNGYKIQRADSLPRRLLGRLYHGLVRLLFGLKVRDVDCDFRLLRRRVVEAIPLTFSSGAICAELMAQIERAGFRVEEVPVHHYPRLSGKSQFFRVGPVLGMVRDVLALWVRLVLLKRGPRVAAGGPSAASAVAGPRPPVSR